MLVFCALMHLANVVGMDVNQDTTQCQLVRRVGRYGSFSNRRAKLKFIEQTGEKHVCQHWYSDV